MSGRTRREFLQTTGLVVGSFITSKLVFGRERSPVKPNILMIMSDEHNASVLGCCGNDIIHTPCSTQEKEQSRLNLRLSYIPD